ncbi:MAG TPA: DUF3667 domain-containing protein [Saprospiraceae bacterium]|nr:DUF3667 domain-containing protein [Saprospiraceae bacterium]
MTTLCKNCGEPVGLHFCPNCGQKSSVQRLELGRLIRELPHAIFHVDKGIFYNVSQLFKRPGAAIQEYLDGKRKPFFHPVTYLVLTLILNYLAVKITDMHFYDKAELETLSPEEARIILEYDDTQWWFLEHTYLYMFLAISFGTLFLYVFFKWMKRDFNMAEVAVIVLFTISQGVLMQSILYFSFGWVRSGVFIRTMEGINASMLWCYASWVIYSMSGQRFARWIRVIFSILAGAGLLGLMIWSAYLLFDISH